jgi:transcriptional regulator with XRE-family HTH domain
MEKQPAELVDQQVAVRIRARRVDQGITLQALARQIGVGRFYQVARVLNVPIGFSSQPAPSARTRADLQKRLRWLGGKDDGE